MLLTENVYGLYRSAFPREFSNAHMSPSRLECLDVSLSLVTPCSDVSLSRDSRDEDSSPPDMSPSLVTPAHPTCLPLIRVDPHAQAPAYQPKSR